MRDKDRDKLLVERFKRGDKSAFDELMRRYQDRIYGIVRRFVDNPEDTSDLCQEIFLRVYESLDDFKGRSSFFTWLYRIAWNLCIDYIRRDRTQPQFVPLEEVSNMAVRTSPSEVVEMKELEDKIAEAVKMLPPQQRRAFILRYYRGMDLESIAKALGCREPTVRSHLCLGRRKVKEMLSPYLEGMV